MRPSNYTTAAQSGRISGPALYKKNQIEKPLERERELHNKKKIDAVADRFR